MYCIVFAFCSVLHKLNRSMRAEVARVELEFWSSGRREPGMTLTENRSWGAMMGPARHLLHDLREVLAQLVVARRCSFESLPSVLCPLCLFCLLSEKDPFKTKINLYKYFSACPRALGQQLRATLTLWHWVFEEARVATGTNKSNYTAYTVTTGNDMMLANVQSKICVKVYILSSALRRVALTKVSPALKDLVMTLKVFSQYIASCSRQITENWLSQMKVPDVAHCERQLMQRRNSGRPVHLPTVVLQPFWIYSHSVHKCTLRWGQ